jgi:D-galactose 1-dehydrogenase
MWAVTATRIAIVGVGKIAQDQHVPSIKGNEAFELAATVSSRDGLPGIENHAQLTELLDKRPDIRAVALCMPPQMRYEAARIAIEAGRHVLLEKPPGATIAEVQDLVERARAKNVSLFATWHSRFAAGVPAARAWLAERMIRHVRITWKEDVRRWHPGQAWIWEPGGLGVFDPGINALSILTEILPEPVHLVQSTLEVPDGRQAPIAASLRFRGPAGLTVEADFDWRQTGPQTWDIEIGTDTGSLSLSKGGAELTIGGRREMTEADVEYAGIYRRFAELIDAREIDVDLAPLIHVADAFMLGRKITVEPFED